MQLHSNKLTLLTKIACEAAVVCRGKNGTPKLGSSGTMDPPELISLQDFCPPENLDHPLQMIWLSQNCMLLQSLDLSGDKSSMDQPVRI